MLGTINLKMDSKFLYYSLLTFYCKAWQRLKQLRVVEQPPQEEPQKSQQRDILQKHLQIDQLIFVSHRIHAINYFAFLRIFMQQGQYAVLSKLLEQQAQFDL